MPLTVKPNPVLERPSGRMLLELSLASSFPLRLPHTFGGEPTRLATEDLYPDALDGKLFAAFLLEPPTISYAGTEELGGLEVVERLDFTIANPQGWLNAYLAKEMRGKLVVAHALDTESGELDEAIFVGRLAVFDAVDNKIRAAAIAASLDKTLGTLPRSRTSTDHFPWIPIDREGFPVPLGSGIGRRVPALLVRARPFDGPGADYWDYVLCHGNAAVYTLHYGNTADAVETLAAQFPNLVEVLPREYLVDGRYCTAIRFRTPGTLDTPLTVTFARAYGDLDRLDLAEWKWTKDFVDELNGITAEAGSRALNAISSPILSDITTAALAPGHVEGIGLGSVRFAKDNHYLELGATAQQFRHTTFTIHGWVYPEGNASECDFIVGPDVNRADTSSSWRVGIDPANDRFRVRAGGSTFYTTPGSAKRRLWTHWALVYSPGALLFYVDGELQIFTAATITFSPTVSSRMMIGIDGANPPLFFRGRVGALRYAPVYRSPRKIAHCHLVGRRNPVEFLREIRKGVLREAIDEASFDQAALDVAAVGPHALQCDGWLTEDTDTQAVLDDIAIFRGIRTTLTEAGAVKVEVSTAPEEVEATFGHGAGDEYGNIVAIRANRRTSLPEATRTLPIRYRQQRSEDGTSGSGALGAFAHERRWPVGPVGRDYRTIGLPFVYTHRTAYEIARWYSGWLRMRDQLLQLTLGSEARKLLPRHIVNVNLPAASIFTAPFRVLTVDRQSATVDVDLMPYDETVYPFAPANYRDRVLLDRPMAYWRLGESAAADDGDIAKDETGIYHGYYTLTVDRGVRSAISRDRDSGAQFRANQDPPSYMWVPVNDDFDFPNNAPFTVECWLRNDVVSSTLGIVCGSQVAIGVLNGDIVTYRGGTTGPSYTPSPTTKVWRHVVMTYDGATISLYGDGSLQDIFADASLLSTVGKHYFAVGAAVDGDLGNGAHFSGSVDEVAVYDYALTDAQVLAHYEAGTSPAAMPFPRDAIIDVRPRLDIGNASRLLVVGSDTGSGLVAYDGVAYTVQASAGNFGLRLEYLNSEEVAVIADGPNLSASTAFQWVTTPSGASRWLVEQDGSDATYMALASITQRKRGRAIFQFAAPKGRGEVQRLVLKIRASAGHGSVAPAVMWPIAQVNTRPLGDPVPVLTWDIPSWATMVTIPGTSTPTDIEAFLERDPTTGNPWAATELAVARLGIATQIALGEAGTTEARLYQLSLLVESLPERIRGVGFTKLFRIGPTDLVPPVPDPSSLHLSLGGSEFVDAVPVTPAGQFYCYYVWSFDTLGRPTRSTGPILVKCV